MPPAKGAHLLNSFHLIVCTFAKRFPFEAIVWTLALISLAVYQPTHTHFTLCPIVNAGFDFCPGCGLGRSISHALHGDFVQAFRSHPLGIFAVITLVYRIVSLTLTHNKLYGKNL